MFGTQHEDQPQLKKKTVHLILNGHPQTLYSHQYSKPLRKVDIEALCDKHMGGSKFKSTRFFSIQGVQLMEEDLGYVRNNDRIYVSRGQDFDDTRNFGEYQLLQTLGEGGFGKVWLAKSSINGTLAAIKILKLQKITGARDIDMVFREVQTLKTLIHPHIVKILNCYALPNMQMIVVMQYLQGGELLKLLKEKKQFDEHTARKIFTQIVKAVSHCHRQGIIHRDLKLQNVLLESKQKLRVKVADFGISGVADTMNPDVDVGTLRYMAPEVLSRREKSNTASVDVWACGVMLYCMVFGRLPFAEQTTAATTQAIITGSYKFPNKNTVSMQCKDLIMIMLTIDPKMRPTINDIQGHPWMSGLYTSKTMIIDRVIEDESSDPIKSSPQKEHKKNELKKKLPAIPKRLQREKEQVMEELRYLRGSRGRIQHSDHKFRVESPPRYMQNIRCKEGQSRGIKRRSSFITGLWK